MIQKKIIFSQSSILANDGAGTDITDGSGELTVNIAQGDEPSYNLPQQTTIVPAGGTPARIAKPGETTAPSTQCAPVATTKPGTLNDAGEKTQLPNDMLFSLCTTAFDQNNKMLLIFSGIIGLTILALLITLGILLVHTTRCYKNKGLEKNN